MTAFGIFRCTISLVHVLRSIANLYAIKNIACVRKYFSKAHYDFPRSFRLFFSLQLDFTTKHAIFKAVMKLASEQDSYGLDP